MRDKKMAVKGGKMKKIVKEKFYRAPGVKFSPIGAVPCGAGMITSSLRPSARQGSRRKWGFLQRRWTVKYLVIMAMGLPLLLYSYNPGQPLPPGAVEVETWYWDGTQWVSQGTGNPEALARLWRSDPEQGSCNKEQWVIPVTVHTSVAQWIEWYTSATRVDWRIRKPGVYASDVVTTTVASNNDVIVDYEGFENLYSPDAVNPEIQTYYAVGDSIENVQWVEAAQINNDDVLLTNSPELCGGMTWTLWNRLDVSECNSSAEYEDEATITLVLQNIKIWIDPATGFFINSKRTMSEVPRDRSTTDHKP